MFKRLLPQEYEFFDYFDQAADQVINAGTLLEKMTQNFGEADPTVRELEAAEHACDEVVRHTIERLNKTFITPMDREDIHNLILKIDDVVDLIQGAANRLRYYQIGQPTEHAKNLAKQISRGCERLSAAIRALRSPKNYDAVLKECLAIHEVENAGDDILHMALADLFANEKDPIKVIKWKDIYESLEVVTDRCEDVANVIQNVIVKMS